MAPKVLALDEPASGLDPQGRREILDLVESLHKRGISCVMVSHSMDDLARLSDRVLTLNEGAVYGLGTPEEIYGDGEALRAIGLGLPQAQMLALELRAQGFHLPRTLYDEATLTAELLSAFGNASRESAL